MLKTLYLWDLAGTLYPEKWNKEVTGAESFDDWIEKQLNKPISEVSPRKYEEMYEIPYTKGTYFNLEIQPDYREVLVWTKYNEAFTTGLQKTNDWRAVYLNPIVGFDIKDYLQKINSSFDYAETNIKTREMLADFLSSKYQEGYSMVVYTDDKLKNCEKFMEAVKLVQKNYPEFGCRVYHLLNDRSGINDKKWHYQIGTLTDLMNNEKRINK